MSDEHTQPHTAIRTFAQDLASARGKRSQGTPDDSSTDPDEKGPIEPKESFKAQAPQQTTRTEPKVAASTKKAVTEEELVENKQSPKEEVADEKVEVKKESLEKTEKQIPTKTPAFIELKQKAKEEIKKDVEAAGKKSQPAPTAPKISVNKKPKKAGRANIGYDAAIITDNKNKRFNLFSAIGNSLKSWFKAFSVSKKKKAPVYTVPDTERRKGIIQRATSKSGSIFTTDSAELRAKIKQRQKLVETEQQENVEGEVSVDEKRELSWSPYTDSGFNLLESPDETSDKVGPHNVTVEFKKQTQPAVLAAATPDIKKEPELMPDTKVEPASVTEPFVPPVPPAPVTKAIPETPVKQEVVTQPIDTRWGPQPEQKVLPVSVEPELKTTASPLIKTEPVAASLPTDPKPQTKNASADSGGLAFETFNTNTLALSIVVGLACVAIIFLVGRIIFQSTGGTEAVVSSDTTTYLQSATPNPVVVTQTNSITDIPLQAGSLLGMDYVDTQLFRPDGEVVPPTTIIAALNFNALPSFTQSLTDIRFAQMNNSAPIIIFEFTDADTALGGFLAWEKTMAEDLREIYLITQLDNLTFSDSRIGNKDVRVLTASTGQVLAVYGIVSRNTAIITDSPETFTRVLNASFDN